MSLLNVFRTTDIVLASCLKLHGYELKQIVCKGKQGTFVFVDVEQLVIEDFNCGRIHVDPVLFYGTVRQLSASVVRQITTGLSQ